LLNHLAIDGQGRIVFDSSDDADEESLEDSSAQDTSEIDGTQTPKATEPVQPVDIPDIDLESLKAKFFPAIDLLDSQDICPSLKNFDLGDPSASLDIPFLKEAAIAEQERSKNVENGEETVQIGGIEDDDDGPIGGFDVLTDVPFGQGGEIWAKEAALESQRRVHINGFGEDGVDGEERGLGDVGAYDPNSDQYGLSLIHGKKEVGHENILSYFDNTLSKNWAGPEHWKIRRVKDSDKQSTSTPRRKEKEVFQIDFLSPLDSTLAETIYTSATSSSSISLPKAQQKSRTRNLLPDDKHFSSRQLLSLFLKPKARLGSRKQLSRQTMISGSKPTEGRDVDEAYWAQQNSVADRTMQEEGQNPNYDANFFQDDAVFPTGLPDDDDDDDFADAREVLSPEAENPSDAPANIDEATNANGDTSGAAFGAQLVTQSNRLRPEYVQYARVAKKVDVRRLKEEIWKGMGLTEVRYSCTIDQIILTVCSLRQVKVKKNHRKKYLRKIH
jgi:condensin complex subunit 2